MITKVYLDMDGVIADFIGRIIEHNPDQTLKSLNDMDDSEFWPLVKSIDNFWSDLPLMPDAKKIFYFLHSNYDLEILSSPASSDNRSILGKHHWLNTNFPKSKYLYKRNFVRARNKQTFASSNSVLIDDMIKNVSDFKSKGGHGILFKNFAQMKKELKKLNEKVL